MPQLDATACSSSWLKPLNSENALNLSVSIIAGLFPNFMNNKPLQLPIPAILILHPALRFSKSFLLSFSCLPDVKKYSILNCGNFLYMLEYSIK